MILPSNVMNFPCVTAIKYYYSRETPTDVQVLYWLPQEQVQNKERDLIV